MCAVYGLKRFYAEVIVTVFKTSRVAKRDDFHSKLLFFVKKIKDNGTQKAVQR